MSTAVEAGRRAAAEWLRPETPPGQLAEEIAAAGAAHLDQQQPGWAQRCHPALAPHDLARRCVEQAPGVDETELIGAWMREIASRRVG